jgi:hypothetical protein
LVWCKPWEFICQRIHTQEPPQPWIINPHAIILLIATAFHLIIILLTIKPIPVIPIAFIIALVAGVVVAEYSTASLDFYEKFVGTRGGFKAGE